jgi:hypothetical protein
MFSASSSLRIHTRPDSFALRLWWNASVLTKYATEREDKDFAYPSTNHTEETFSGEIAIPMPMAPSLLRPGNHTPQMN